MKCSQKSESYGKRKNNLMGCVLEHLVLYFPKAQPKFFLIYGLASAFLAGRS